MTVADLLRDMRAATLSRVHYERQADKLAEAAIKALHDGYPEWAVEWARLANIAQRAAFAETVDPEP